jgi:hypothetical protein
MATYATILQPLNGDTVTAPVTVKAGYDTTSNFTLKCWVGTAVESANQQHNGTGVHSTTSPDVAAVAGVNQTVYARDDNNNEFDHQDGVNVTSGTPAVTVEGVTPQMPSGPVVRGKSRRVWTIKGKCDPAGQAANVVCEIYEVNIRTHARRLIGANSEDVTNQAGQRTWTVQVTFQMDMQNNDLEYVARAHAYDANGNPVGLHTQHHAK